MKFHWKIIAMLLTVTCMTLYAGFKADGNPIYWLFLVLASAGIGLGWGLVE